MPKTEPTNEEDVKRAAELKEWLEARMLELENELGRLKDMQQLVDSVLRRNSFVPAAALKSTQTKPSRGEKVDDTKNQVPKSQDEPRQLRRSKDGLLIASAFVSPEKLVVVPSSDVRISQTIPPFQTFFVNRILKGYESKDQELVASGKLSQSEAMSYSVEEEEGNISKVTVQNYRDKSRLNEILSTVNWAFTRMLEKK
ncbi:MAG TPA: hypothetical protein VNE86_00220 [Nitrososphaerales archaeon]|nr:hypothetical protein [Nitrososphaerales archaeon]